MRTGSRGRLGLATSLICLLAVAALLSACSLASLFYPGDPAFTMDPGSSFALPGSLSHGTATIEITSGKAQTIQLPHLSADEPSMYEPNFGAMITWRGGDWSLRIESFGAGSALGDQGTLTIGREDTDPPMAADASNCTITYTSQTADHFAGTATCTNLVWSTQLGLDGGMDVPAPSGSAPAGLPSFDATITFDATP